MAVPPLFVVDSVVSCARVSVAGDERLVDRLHERRRVAVGAVDGMPSRARVHTAGWQWRRCSEAYYGDLLQIKAGRCGALAPPVDIQQGRCGAGALCVKADVQVANGVMAAGFRRLHQSSFNGGDALAR